MPSLQLATHGPHSPDDPYTKDPLGGAHPGGTVPGGGDRSRATGGSAVLAGTILRASVQGKFPSHIQPDQNCDTCMGNLVASVVAPLSCMPYIFFEIA